MFEALAGMFMAMKVNFCQMKYHMFKRQDRVVAETIYLNEVDKVDEKEKYERRMLAVVLSKRKNPTLKFCKNKKEWGKSARIYKIHWFSYLQIAEIGV